jgi:hypothetical protein
MKYITASSINCALTISLTTSANAQLSVGLVCNTTSIDTEANWTISSPGLPLRQVEVLIDFSPSGSQDADIQTNPSGQELWQGQGIGPANQSSTTVSGRVTTVGGDQRINIPVTTRACRGTLDCNPTPIIVDLGANGYQLTDSENGVYFDFNGDGVRGQVSWTAATSDEAFLTLDRNHNRVIDDGSELFGNYSPQPYSTRKNGFAALAVYDNVNNGGNNDSYIDENDRIYSELLLWKDSNHDGVSQASEFLFLKDAGLARISLNYKESKRVDQYGNKFEYRSREEAVEGTKIGRWAYDITLVAGKRLLSQNKIGSAEVKTATTEILPIPICP